MRGLTAVALACAVAVAVAASAFGAVAPKKPSFPTKCSQVFTLAVADSATGHTFTSIGTDYENKKGFQSVSCYFHDADYPPDTSGQPGAVSLNHVVEVGFVLRTPKIAAFFAKMEKEVEAQEPGRTASLSFCQPGAQLPTGGLVVTPSMCAVLHPFGADSFEYYGAGLMVLTPKYLISSLSTLHDTLQEPLVRLLLAKLK